MATTLPDYIFDYIGVTNGGWRPIEVPAIPLLVNGSSNSDDIAVTPIALSVVNGNDGNDRITIVGNLALATTLDGGRGEDQIFGGRGIDTIDGGHGNDYIVGGAGADILQDTGTGDDDGDGIPDTDTISYEDAVALSGSVTGITLTLNASGGASMNAGGTNAGSDSIRGGFENVVGSKLNDVITGNAGNNILIGLGGDDELNGGDGNDILNGGAGADRLNGGAGIDTADFSGTGSGVRVNLVQGTATIGQVTDTLGSIENIIGSSYSDIVAGDRQNNRLEGLGGDDMIVAGPGDDVLIGGGGKDTMYGDPGADSFVFQNLSDMVSTGSSPDLIRIFENGQDKIDLSAIDADPNLADHQPLSYFGIGQGGPGTVGFITLSSPPFGPLLEVIVRIDNTRYLVHVDGVDWLFENDFILQA
jgi:Ca2+-binding RTX toxin-like protein